MIEARNWFHSLQVDKTLRALRKNGFDVTYVPTKEDAVSTILELVPSNALVGLGGSVTLREIGLPAVLRARGNNLADHWEARRKRASAEDIMAIRKLHQNSDVFITSANAVTETGELINIDGSGQRVAAMIFGPKKVLVVVGVNKIAHTLDEGLWRAQNVAAPMNAKRLNVRTPCAVSGVCNDCASAERICAVTSIMHRRPQNTAVTVVLVGETLGY